MTGNRGGFAFIRAVHEQIPGPVFLLRSFSIRRQRRCEAVKWPGGAVVGSPDAQKEAAKIVPLAEQRKEFCTAFVAAPSCPEDCEGSGRHPTVPTRATCDNVRQTVSAKRFNCLHFSPSHSAPSKVAMKREAIQ